MPRDRRESDTCLPGPGGEHDEPATVRDLPRAQSVFLIRTQLDAAPGAAGSHDRPRPVPEVDGWGTPYQTYANEAYGSATKQAKVYAIISAGKDQIIEADPTKGPFTNFDCDIVYSNGVFLSYPDGLTFNK